MADRQLYLITDRTALGSGAAALDALVALVTDAVSVGIDWIQLREKDLSARELHGLARRIQAATVQRARTTILVNDRFDVAQSAGLDGVHLTTRSIPASHVRACVGDTLRIGVSTHSESEARAAEAGGADFVVCGLAFPTPSKAESAQPLGAQALARIGAGLRIPLLALGGVDSENAGLLRLPGIAGVAAIRMFQETWLAHGRDGLGLLAERLRS